MGGAGPARGRRSPSDGEATSMPCSHLRQVAWTAVVGLAGSPSGHVARAAPL